MERPEPRIETLPVGALAANCYLVICPTTGEAAVLDPGDEAQRILDRIRSLGVNAACIVHTHGHFDHISATEQVLAGLPQPVPVLGHPADEYLYSPAARQMGAAFGYPLPETLVRPDRPLADSDEIQVGELSLRVLHSPGHTPGSVSLVCDEHVVFSGDTLFHRGIGRTDLPGGDEEAIYTSILTRLYTLPEAMIVYPGHGETTTIGEEQRANPFVQADR